MHLSEILEVERIDVAFSATSKSAAVEGMAELLAKGIARADRATAREAIRGVLEAREALLSTGVGSGVAIPHGRIAGIERFVGALAIQHEGVEFGAIDGAPVSILFAIVGPDKAASEHLKCLARVGRLLRDDDVRRRLLEAKSAERALDIVRAEDG